MTENKTISSVKWVRTKIVFRFFPLKLLLLYISLWYKSFSSNGDDLELSHLSHPRCLLEGEFCVREGSEKDRETGLSHQESQRVHLSHLHPLLLPFRVPTPSLHLIPSCLFLLSIRFSCSYTLSLPPLAVSRSCALLSL